MFFTKRHVAIAISIIVITLVAGMLFSAGQQKGGPRPTAIVDSGTVTQTVAVSGRVETSLLATLGFPTGGIVESLNVSVGEQIQAGEILGTLESRTLAADRLDALAALATAEANRNELFVGVTSEARFVTEETVRNREAALERTRLEQTQTIENARRVMYSSGLIARTNRSNELATPPVVSGTYTCEEAGTYYIAPYRSGGDSGYSYRVTGLETGTYIAATAQPAPFGSCGLFLQFTPDDQYNNSVWEITIPNTTSALYIPNLNAYELAKIAAESKITLAERELELAKANAANTTAPARAEAVARANAAVAQAEARLARADAQLRDRSLRAPFTGTVTSVDTTAGEMVGTTPVITLVAESDFTVIARIPEIDISDISLGQTTKLIFDTKPDEPLAGTVTYLSPSASDVNGVAYFEVHIILNETPDWLRDGLSADVDIIVAEAADALRLPTRFIQTIGTDAFVTRVLAEGDVTTPIEIILTGNDGYTAITGLTAGDIVVSP